MSITALLLIALALFVIGLLAFHAAPRGPLPIAKYEPNDNAHVYAVVREARSFKLPAKKGLGVTPDTERRPLALVARAGARNR